MTATELKLTGELFLQLESVYAETYTHYNDNWRAEYHTKKKLEGIISQAKIHKFCVEMNKTRKEALKIAPRKYSEGVGEWMEILLANTSDMKEEYLRWTEKWAGEQVERNINRKNRYSEKYGKVNMDGIRSMTAVEKKVYYNEQKFYYNSAPYIFDVVSFTKRALYDSEQHYLSNLENISRRLIIKKMLPVDTKIHSSRIGVNLDLTMTNSETYVKAWTIIASGPIQRPHYRYLIK